jgi:hypothetical protein
MKALYVERIKSSQFVVAFMLSVFPLAHVCAEADAVRWFSTKDPPRDNSGVEFSTRVPWAGVDAPVSFLDGTPVGAGFTAQLYGGSVGTPVEALSPLFPTTTFSIVPPFPPELAGHVVRRFVDLPGFLPGQQVTLVMRAFSGPSWEDSTCRGESNPLTIELFGPRNPPPVLRGLEPFQVDCVAEPSPLALLGGAAGVLLLALRGRSRRDCYVKQQTAARSVTAPGANSSGRSAQGPESFSGACW